MRAWVTGYAVGLGIPESFAGCFLPDPVSLRPHVCIVWVSKRLWDFRLVGTDATMTVGAKGEARHGAPALGAAISAPHGRAASSCTPPWSSLAAATPPRS
ncbi:hypothetical protein GCM10027053_49520 [Intrasporangium mesophilum]